MDLTAPGSLLTVSTQSGLFSGLGLSAFDWLCSVERGDLIVVIQFDVKDKRNVPAQALVVVGNLVGYILSNRLCPPQ